MEIVRTEKLGRFTLVQIKDNDMFSVGIARCSDKDKMSRQRGITIAKGRAIKASQLKKKGEHITKLLMG